MKNNNSDSYDSVDDIDNESEINESDSGIEVKDNKNITETFSVKELCYYKMIKKFFTQCSEENILKMIDIIEGKSNISLRILDWFVTKYSKKRLDCGIKNTKNTEIFDVRISYKSQLKSYKKRYFDPFRRRERFVYNFENTDTKISTTIGQLNFFKWAFTNGIITYVEKNLKQISKEMNHSNKEEKKKKKIKVDNENQSSEEDIKKKKIKKNKKNNDNESTGNIKINAIKTTENDEVQIILKFD